MGFYSPTIVVCSSSFFIHLASNSSFSTRPFFPPKTKCFSKKFHVACSTSTSPSDPLLVKAARGDPVSRPPAWMMRQAGRYMSVYRKLAERYPSFRERSETTDLIVEISLQPWEAFHPDGVIIFSDILTLYLPMVSHLTWKK